MSDSAYPLELGAEFRDLDREIEREPSLDGAEYADPERERWREPLPLRPEAEAAPSLRAEMLPAALADYAADEARRAVTPLEMVAVPLIVAAGSVVGRRLALYPKARDDWHEFPNAWGAIVALPSSLKSPALQAGLRIIRTLAAEASEKFEAETRPALERKVAELELRIAAAKGSKGARSADLGDLEQRGAEVADLQRELAEVKARMAAPPRYDTTDTTVEALGPLLIANPRGLLVHADELAGWLASLEREGHEGSREFYLSGWDAKGSLRIDRIGRGSLYVPGVCLSILGSIQPGKLSRYVSEAAGGGRGADGLLQRFSLLVWPDLEPFVYRDEPPNLAARARVDRYFRWLDRLDPEALGAQGSPPGLRYDAEAQSLFVAWYTETITRARAEKSEALAAYLSKLPKLFTALSLLAWLAELSEGASPGPVPARCAALAGDLCDYAEGHARKVYARFIEPGRSAAKALAAKLKDGSVPDGMTVRDLKDAGWRDLSQPEPVEAALSELADRGWCRIETKRDTGGRPSRVVRINPAVLEGRCARGPVA